MRIYLSIICSFFLGSVFGQMTYVVNSTDDTDDGVCDGVHCSIVEAFNANNSDNVSSNIHFNIPGPGQHTINLTSGQILEILEDNSVVDGLTQPGNSPMNGKIRIISQGGPYIISILSNNTIISGLLLEENSSLIQVNGSNSIISNNFLGNSDISVSGAGGFNIDISNNYFYSSKMIHLEASDVIFSNNIIGKDPAGIIKPVQFGIHSTQFNWQIINNEFWHGYSVLSIDPIGSIIHSNKLFCNSMPSDPATIFFKSPPNITSITPTLISVTGTPGDYVQLYKVVDDDCENTACQGGLIMDEVVVDASSNWVSNSSVFLVWGIE